MSKSEMPRKLYMHIGFGKTGSTSLQTFLFSNPELNATSPNEKLLYCSLSQHGITTYGQNLTGVAEHSFNAKALSEPTAGQSKNFSAIKNDLDKIFSAGYTPVFSQEDWWRRSEDFKNSNLLKEVGCTAHIIAYVRPQVDWLNSAWWQWGAWRAWDKEFSTPQDVIGKWGFIFMSWGHFLIEWGNVPGVENVIVRLFPQDIVADYMNVFGIQDTPKIVYPARSNVSLSATHYKLLLRYPKLMAPPDRVAESVLSKNLRFTGKTPWVIESELANKIIAATHTDNIQLLGMLDEQSRALMEKDPRWWDANCYSSRPLFSQSDLELGKDELIEIIKQAEWALKKFQLINSHWWHPDFYSCRPLIPRALSILDRQTLIDVVDQIIPALIRLEIIHSTKSRRIPDAQPAIHQGHVSDTSHWVNTKALRFVHKSLIDIPFRIVRRIRRELISHLR